MTQQTLSSLCDIDIRTIQRIEKGEHNLSMNILFAIAEALKIPAHELIIVSPISLSDDLK